jgi:tRNA(Ile)-lysidine synthetase-like protein
MLYLTVVEVMPLTSILNQALLQENDSIVVAVSGGIDSMVLLDALCALRETYHLTLIVAHVNHRVRNESEEEYVFVAQQCKAYDVAFEGMTLVHDPTDNFHNYSHIKRYQFFYETAQKYYASKIALAHHADDLSETILMRLVRGSSFIGYAGILEQVPYQTCQLIRPLLAVTRKEIVHYQTTHHLEFRSDASNEEDKYTRNRFRHHLMPLIEQEDPRYRAKFAQFSTYLTEAYALIHRLAENFIQTAVKWTGGEASLSLVAFTGLDRVIARDVIKKIVDQLTGDQVELSFAHFENVLKITTSPKPNARITIDRSLRVLRRYDELCFQTSTPIESPVNQPIYGFGTTVLSNGDTVIIGENPSNSDGISIELWYNNLDFVFPLTVRNRQNGDRIKLTDGTKKINDLLIDRKVVMQERNRILVFLNPHQEVLWIPGYRISPLAREGASKIHLTYVRRN